MAIYLYELGLHFHQITLSSLFFMQFYFNPYNTTEYVNCNDYVIANFGAVSAFYNTYNAAMDLKETIEIINPPKLGIYALSYGTYFTNTYMQLPGARYDAVILDGPLPPGRWLMEFNAIWNSHVSQDLISLCVRESSVCSEAFDSMGHYPRLIMDQLIDGSLKCLDKLPWLREENGVHLVRTYNNYLTASKDAQVLMGPFWHRMLRCTDEDATQLTTFHNQRVAADTYRSPTYDYSYGLGINILASELYSLADANSSLSYENQLVVMSRLFSDGGGQYSSSFARDVSHWPRYTPNPISRTFASPAVPVLILAGTLDPNTQFGLGKWYRGGLGVNAQLVEVPYATHGTLTATDTCVHLILTDFFTSWGTSVNTSCIYSDYYSLPDFDGSEAPAQGLSQYMFGTADVWNNGFLIDTNATNIEDETVTNSSSDCNWEDEDVEIVLGSTLAAFFVVVCLIVLFFTMKWAPKTSDGLMSDSKL